MIRLSVIIDDSHKLLFRSHVDAQTLEYRFMNLDTSDTQILEKSDSTNPSIDIGESVLIYHLAGSASAPLIIPPGIVYGDDAASLIDGLATTTSFTFAFWVYLFRTDQTAYIFAEVRFKCHF